MLEEQKKLERQRIESEAKLKESHQRERVKLEEQISTLKKEIESLKTKHSIAETGE